MVFQNGYLPSKLQLPIVNSVIGVRNTITQLTYLFRALNGSPFARAMLKNAPILILDEATSSLDSVTEKLIQESLHILMQGRTTIVVAHRLSTLSDLDRIIVFDKGAIIEEGTKEHLLSLHGRSAKLWNMQTEGFLPDGA